MIQSETQPISDSELVTNVSITGLSRVGQPGFLSHISPSFINILETRFRRSSCTWDRSYGRRTRTRRLQEIFGGLPVWIRNLIGFQANRVAPVAAASTAQETPSSGAAAPPEVAGPQPAMLITGNLEGGPSAPGGSGLAVAILLFEMRVWYLAAITGAVSFVFYHAAANSHPALYALEPNCDANSVEFRNTMAGVTGMPLIEGNSVEIYNDGDNFYPAMLDAIESAKSSVTMEQFILSDGQVGRRFAQALADKASEGVPVKLLADAIGSARLSKEITQMLEAGGCHLAWFHPVHWLTLHRANLRTHRKSLIVDGRTAFTGGAGLADHWIGTAANEHQWRDVEIRVEGPAVAAQQSGFAQNWLLSTGEILSGPEFFPMPQSAGDIQVQTILTSPSSGACAVATMHLIAVQCARSHVHRHPLLHSRCATHRRFSPGRATGSQREIDGCRQAQRHLAG